MAFPDQISRDINIFARLDQLYIFLLNDSNCGIKLPKKCCLFICLQRYNCTYQTWIEREAGAEIKEAFVCCLLLLIIQSKTSTRQNVFDYPTASFQNIFGGKYLQLCSSNYVRKCLDAVGLFVAYIVLRGLRTLSYNHPWAETKNKRTSRKTEKIDSWQRPLRHNGLGHQVTTTMAVHLD